jgi:hypothetical protein
MSAWFGWDAYFESTTFSDEANSESASLGSEKAPFDLEREETPYNPAPIAKARLTMPR